MDGYASWFCNPQYRLLCSTNTELWVSVTPYSSFDNEGQEVNLDMTITLTTSKMKPDASMQLWGYDKFTHQSSEKDDLTASSVKDKGQESCLWGVKCEPGNYYHIIVNANKRGLEGSFLLRVFSHAPILMEEVPTTPMHTMHGEWKRIRDKDSTGGNLTYNPTDGTVKENAKFCQNPQYHIELGIYTLYTLIHLLDPYIPSIHPPTPSPPSPPYFLT